MEFNSRESGSVRFAFPSGISGGVYGVGEAPRRPLLGIRLSKVTPATSVIDARVVTVSTLSSSAASAAVSAVIWIVISAFTGSPAAFVIFGAILCGLVVFVVGYSIRRVAIHR